MKTKPASPSCLRCQNIQDGSPQIFEWWEAEEKYTYIFDTDLAYAKAKIISPEIYTMTPQNFQEIIQDFRNSIDSTHLPHLAPYSSLPGLIGTAKNGKHILVDGTHRALYNYQQDKPFTFYLLPWEFLNLTRVCWVEKLLNDQKISLDEFVAKALAEKAKGQH